MYLWFAFGVVLALIWASRAMDAFFGLRRIPDISSGGAPSAPESLLTIIVPARNEAQSIEAAIRSLLELDYREYEIIAVDDRSTDHTGAILERLAAEAGGRLRVLHVTDLPSRWLGKTHAMWLAATQAKGDWLLFTDADVVFRPDSLCRAVAHAEQIGADHLVLAPELQMHTPGERMMLAFFQLMFVFGHRPWKVADPRAADHIGVGAFNLIRRSVYERIGTYRALRLSVLDDMKLGQFVKQSGFAQRYVIGGDLVSLRWACGGFGVMHNLTKNFFAILQYRLWRTVGFTALLMLFNLGPYVGVAFAPGLARVGYAAALAVIACMYLGMSWYSQVTPRYFLLHPIATILFDYTVVRSAVLTLVRGAVVWRGTRYPLDELRREMV
jgi:glycosyltransferase involved in cell wall biosynthesis